jgi:hypothetical protein
MIWAAIIVELALSIKFGANWPDFAVLMGLQFINGSLSLCAPALCRARTARSGEAVCAVGGALRSGSAARGRQEGVWSLDGACRLAVTLCQHFRTSLSRALVRAG